MRSRFLGCLLLVVLLAACTATSMSVTCNNPEDNATVCDLDMGSLNGVWSQEVKINLDSGAAIGSAALHLDLTVDTGVVRVSFLDGLGDRLTYEVTSDTPLVIEETAQVATGSAVVTFESINGPATGVIARIRVSDE